MKKKRSGIRLFLYLPLLATLNVSFTALAQTNPDPQRWAAEMAAFAQQDNDRPTPKGAIVLTGSSSIARWQHQAAEVLAPLTVIPRGFGGSVMADVLFHLDTLALQYQPRAILIYEGDNDTGSGISTEVILNQLHQIIDRVHEQLPETRVYVLAVKPSILRKAIWDKAQEVNAGYQAIAAADPLVIYVDTATPFLDKDGQVMDDLFVQDNLHFNDLGNLIWGSVLRSALMPREARFEQGY